MHCYMLPYTVKSVYPDIPNSKLKELIDKNKEMYPDAFKKPCQ